MIELSVESPGQPPRVQRFSSAVITVGRATDCELCVEDPAASRRHCRISRGLQGWLVEDLGSANGTRVAGERIVGAVTVAPGVAIEIGALCLRVGGRPVARVAVPEPGSVGRRSVAPGLQIRALEPVPGDRQSEARMRAGAVGQKPVPEDRRVAARGSRAVPRDRLMRSSRVERGRGESRLVAWFGVMVGLGVAGLGGWGSAQAWDQPLVLRAPAVPGCDGGDPRLRQADVLADAAAQEPDPTQAVRTALTALRQAQALGCAERSRAGAVLVNVLARLGSQQLGRHTSALQGLAAAADSRVVALDGDGQVMVWDREAPGQVLAGVSGAQAVGRSGDGRWLAVGDAQGGLRWWELADGEWVAAQSEVSGVERGTRVLAVDGDGRTIRVDDDGQVEVWTRLPIGEGEARWTRSATLLAWPGATRVQVAGSRLLIVGAGRAAVWSIDASGAVHGVAQLLATGAAITAAALDEAGTQAVTGDAAGGVTRWRLGRRARPEPLAAHGGAVHAVVWVGGAVASVGADDALRVAELDRRVRREGPPLVLVADTPVPVDRLVLVDSGRWLVGSGPTGAIVTWDLQQRSRRLPASLRPGHRGPVTALVAGEGWVATGGEDGVVRAWDLVAPATVDGSDEGLVARACRALGWGEPGCRT